MALEEFRSNKLRTFLSLFERYNWDILHNQRVVYCRQPGAGHSNRYKISWIKYRLH